MKYYIIYTILVVNTLFLTSCSSDSSNPVTPTVPFSATPLIDLVPPNEYKSEAGGLYGSWSNEIPSTHKAAALNEIAKIEPLDASGNPSASGKVVMISIGMSNTFYSFEKFQAISNTDPDKAPELFLLNGAQVGHDAIEWATDDRQDWEKLEAKLSQQNLTPAQVQIAWIYLAYRDPVEPFPTSAKNLQGYIQTVLNTLQSKYPNIRIAYLTSREYAGYSMPNASNPEPYAYESAFAVRWLIEDQMNGAAELNFDPAKGEVKSPIIVWGPYTWADGLNPRSDGLTWARADFNDEDGMHPSDQGYSKLGNIMHDFFKNNELSSSWFNK